jgi:hypothetical protein
MRQVFKYELATDDTTILILPKGAKFLKFDSQHNKPVTWWLVDPKAEKELKKFFLVGTGQELPDESDNWTYLGTAKFSNDNLIFHLFTLGE